MWKRIKMKNVKFSILEILEKNSNIIEEKVQTYTLFTNIVTKYKLSDKNIGVVMLPLLEHDRKMSLKEIILFLKENLPEDISLEKNEFWLEFLEDWIIKFKPEKINNKDIAKDFLKNFEKNDLLKGLEKLFKNKTNLGFLMSDVLINVWFNILNDKVEISLDEDAIIKKISRSANFYGIAYKHSVLLLKGVLLLKEDAEKTQIVNDFIDFHIKNGVLVNQIKDWAFKNGIKTKNVANSTNLDGFIKFHKPYKKIINIDFNELVKRFDIKKELAQNLVKFFIREVERENSAFAEGANGELIISCKNIGDFKEQEKKLKNLAEIFFNIAVFFVENNPDEWGNLWAEKERLKNKQNLENKLIKKETSVNNISKL